jgi:thiamine-phosphate pyrophosphorylase
VAVARSLARSAGRPNFLIGLSTHSLAQARAGEREGADYIGYGPIYATQTKEHNVAAVGPASLAPVLASVAVPVVAIGGIKLGHLAALASMGARHCAIVTALTSAENVAGAAAEHWTLWRESQERPSVPGA